MKIVVAPIGKCKNPQISELAGIYYKRLKGYVSIEIIEVEEKNRDIKKQVAGLLGHRGHLIILDSNGKMMDSRVFAQHLENLISKYSRIVFMIGGAEGYPKWLLDMAGEKISLSPMTFQHDIARLVLMEQLYRAFTIIRGEPYHK